MSDDGQRIAALEVKVQYLTETVERMDDTVTELRDLLIGAKAVRWVLGLLIGIASFLGGGLLQKFFPILTK